MPEKKWKDALLSSGLALEHDVRQRLRGLGLPTVREYTYRRTTEAGKPAEFSLDVHASWPCVFPSNLWVELLIECKYRHQSVDWVFIPDTDASSRLFPADAFAQLDLLADADFPDRQTVSRFTEAYTICSKGVELLPTGPNPKSIKQGLEQLRFATADAFVTTLRSDLDSPTEHWNHVFVPILVTTAGTWRVSTCGTLDDVREAKDIGSVCDRCDVLWVYQPPGNELSAFTRDRFHSLFEGDDISRLEFALRGSGWSGSFQSYAEFFSSTYPRLFLVARYQALDGLVRRVLAMYDRGYSPE